MRRPPPRLTTLAVAAATLALSPSAQAQSGVRQTRAPMPAVGLPTPPAPRPAAAAPSSGGACDRAVRTAAFAFADEDAFHQRLTGALAPRPETLAVDVPRPFAPETTPDRLHAWMVATARNGGAVVRRDIPCGSATGVTRPVTFGVRAFLTRPSGQVNAAVRGYDAVLWVEQATGAVTQVQFVRRAA